MEKFDLLELCFQQKEFSAALLSLLYPLETSGTRVQNTDVNLKGDNLCHRDRHTESEHTKEESENNNALKWLPRQAAQEARLRVSELINADDETI